MQEGISVSADTHDHQVTVLFFSNGHGEDAVGAAIAEELGRMAPSWRRWAAPIVGDGAAYRRLGLPIVVPTGTMPSGGFRHVHRFSAIWQDLRAGLIRLHLRQAARLRRLARQVDLVVGVGDRVVLEVTRWILRRPLIMVAVADSAHLTEGRTISNPQERRLMQRYACRVFTRDELSAQLLRQHGVPAEFVGNPMMDALRITGDDLGLAPNETLVALLPGSRQEAYRNFLIILDGVAELASRHPAGLRFMAAWPENLPVPGLLPFLAGRGWQWQEPAGTPEATREGRLAVLVGPGAVRVELVAGRFGDILHRATLVIGMAGTANEQAAGLGKPVITCPGTGPQVTTGLVRRQVLLLGEAVRPVEPTGRAIAEAAVQILTSPDLYRRMSEAGRRRMGGQGAAARIAAEAVREVRRQLSVAVLEASGA